MKLMKRMLVIVLVSIICVGCDQSTKFVADSYLQKTKMYSYLSDTVRIGYVENTGAFLGMGGQLPEKMRVILFQAIVGVFLASLLVYALIGSNLTLLGVAGISLMLSGGASNLYDRLVNDGAVIDFINIGIGVIRTGVFNVADIAIMVGGLVLVFSGSKHIANPEKSGF